MRVPLLNFEGGPGIPLLNFEGGPGVPLLNFERVPGSLVPGSRGLRSRGPGPTFTPCLENKNSKNLIITLYYRQPSGVIKGLNSFLENVFKKANTENKLCFVAGDFNLNCLDYNKNLEIRTFSNRIFAHSCIL